MGLTAVDGPKGPRTRMTDPGRAVPNVTDWQYLNLNYVAKAKIDQDACIKCGRCLRPVRTPRTRRFPWGRRRAAV